MGVITAVLAHSLMTAGYITVVKNISNYVDKKVNSKKDES